MDSQSIPNRTLSGRSRSCSAYLSYRHQFLSNRPKNWAPNTPRAYLYKSDEFFDIWMVFPPWNSEIQMCLYPNQYFRSEVQLSEDIFARVLIVMRYCEHVWHKYQWFGKHFQNYSRSTKTCSGATSDHVCSFHSVTGAVWVIWWILIWGPYGMDCELLL